MAVYLLHFDRPYQHARHYAGFAEDDQLIDRIEVHRRATDGDGKHHRLMQVIRAAGIGFSLVRVWRGKDRTFERRLKDRNNLSRECPICRDLRRNSDESSTI